MWRYSMLLQHSGHFLMTDNAIHNYNNTSSIMEALALRLIHPT